MSADHFQVQLYDQKRHQRAQISLLIEMSSMRSSVVQWRLLCSYFFITFGLKFLKVLKNTSVLNQTHWKWWLSSFSKKIKWKNPFFGWKSSSIHNLPPNLGSIWEFEITVWPSTEIKFWRVNILRRWSRMRGRIEILMRCT